jgi:putative transposase
VGRTLLSAAFDFDFAGAPFLARSLREKSALSEAEGWGFSPALSEIEGWGLCLSESSGPKKPASVHPSQRNSRPKVYRIAMPWGLKRYYGAGGLHFITWSCYHRQPLLATPAERDLLLTVLERMREKYRFAVIGYVVMPEHVHLLVSEPQLGNPSTVVQAVKLGFARRSMRHRVWQRRFYDFNLWSQRKEIEKLKYMHRNPVVRGLVEEPGQWTVPTPTGKPGWSAPTVGPGGRRRFAPAPP